MKDTITTAIFMLSIPSLIVLSIWTPPVVTGVLLGVVSLGLILALIFQRPLGQMIGRRPDNANSG